MCKHRVRTRKLELRQELIEVFYHLITTQTRRRLERDEEESEAVSSQYGSFHSSQFEWLQQDDLLEDDQPTQRNMMDH